MTTLALVIATAIALMLFSFGTGILIGRFCRVGGEADRDMVEHAEPTRTTGAQDHA